MDVVGSGGGFDESRGGVVTQRDADRSRGPGERLPFPTAQLCWRCLKRPSQADGITTLQCDIRRCDGGAIRCAVCASASRRFAHESEARANDRQDHEEDQCQRHRDRRSIARNGLTNQVEPRLRRGQQCAAMLILVDIRRQIDRAAITSIAILAHRFERNPFQLALQHANQCLCIGLSIRRDLIVRRFILERPHALARTWRIDLANQPAQLLVGAAGDFALIERAQSGQKLIKQNAQRIDVGARVEID